MDLLDALRMGPSDSQSTMSHPSIDSEEDISLMDFLNKGGSADDDDDAKSQRSDDRHSSNSQIAASSTVAAISTANISDEKRNKKLSVRLASAFTLRTKEQAIGGSGKKPFQLVKKESDIQRLSNPQFLSLVSRAFRDQIQLNTNAHENIEYSNSFTGKEAVSLLSKLMGDRSIALQAAISLLQQKLYVDVLYTRKFSEDLLYIFNQVLGVGQSLNGEEVTILDKNDVQASGIFPLECYTPRCSTGCYAPRCPKRVTSTKSLQSSKRKTLQQEQKLWSQSVGKNVVEQTSEHERKRQEIIFEIIKTEKEYVDDLHLLRTVYLEPLRRADIIPKTKRDDFIRTVFGNIDEVIQTNERLFQKLEERQSKDSVVSGLGDIFQEWNGIECYVSYGANQALSKNTLDTELITNIVFQKFCEANERRPECRKLPIQSFLTRPTTRMGRYPILLDNLSSKSQGEEAAQLNSSSEKIRDILSRINEEAGKADNLLRLRIINDRLPEHIKDTLNLLEPGRKLIREGILRKKGTTEFADLEVFLFDHFLLLLRKNDKKYEVYHQPIPVFLLKLVDHHSSDENFGMRRKSISTFIRDQSPRRGSFSSDMKKEAFPLHLVHLGSNGAQYTLYCSSFADKRQWTEKIEHQLLDAYDRMQVFRFQPVFRNEPPEWLHDNAILSTAQCKGKMLVATENGIWFGNENFSKLLDIPRVSQMEIVEDFKVILLLSERKLLTCPLDALEQGDMKKIRRLSSNVAFFKVGVNYEKKFVVAVKTKILSTYLKVFEHVDFEAQKKKRVSLSEIILRQVPYDEDFKLFKHVYIPSETTCLLFLKTKICVGCLRGFELVDLLTLNTQALVDPTDKNLSFLQNRDDLNPLGMFRITEEEYLLCYKSFGVYVDKLGFSSRSTVLQWYGSPHAFAYEEPHLIGFESGFAEIYNAHTATFEQILPLDRLRNVQLKPSIVCASTHVIQVQSNPVTPTSPISPKQQLQSFSKRLQRAMSETSRLSSRENSPTDSGSQTSLHQEEVRISTLHELKLWEDDDSATFVDSQEKLQAKLPLGPKIPHTVRPRTRRRLSSDAGLDEVFVKRKTLVKVQVASDNDDEEEEETIVVPEMKNQAPRKRIPTDTISLGSMKNVLLNINENSFDQK